MPITPDELTKLTPYLPEIDARVGGVYRANGTVDPTFIDRMGFNLKLPTGETIQSRGGPAATVVLGIGGANNPASVIPRTGTPDLTPSPIAPIAPTIPLANFPSGIPAPYQTATGQPQQTQVQAPPQSSPLPLQSQVTPSFFQTPEQRANALKDAGVSEADVNKGNQPPPAEPSSTSPALPTPPTDLQGIMTQFGLGGATSLDDVIKKVSDSFGLKEVNNEMKALDDKHLDDVASVNSNPWISEGLRSKQVTQLQEKYERKKEALISRLRLQESVVGKAIDVYYKDRELQKDLLFKALNERSKEIDRHKAFELSAGQARFQYNPTTGQYEKIASLPGRPVSAGAPGSLEEFNTVYGRNPKSLEELNTFTAGRQKAKTKPAKDIFTEAQNTLQQYKDRGYSRQQVEDEWRKQNAQKGQDPTTVAPPLTVQKALDNLYGPSASLPSKPSHWYNPLSWF